MTAVDRFLHRLLGRVQVKGRKQPLSVYDFFMETDVEVV
jgi:hypothetical protein